MGAFFLIAIYNNQKRPEAMSQTLYIRPQKEHMAIKADITNVSFIGGKSNESLSNCTIMAINILEICH